MLLTDKLIETARTYPHSQRRIGSYLGRLGRLVRVEQPVVHCRRV
jgi:hypothetical protein